MDRETDEQNASGYYSSLHCEQCGRAVKKWPKVVHDFKQRAQCICHDLQRRVSRGVFMTMWYVILTAYHSPPPGVMLADVRAHLIHPLAHFLALFSSSSIYLSNLQILARHQCLFRSSFRSPLAPKIFFSQTRRTNSLLLVYTYGQLKLERFTTQKYTSCLLNH